ncbi:MAG: prepilin-type N-terminal cleavage/methylation domain-containing protein [Pygmaiobacter sp.]
MNTILKDRRGITLVEMMVAISLLLIVLPAIFLFQQSVQKRFDYADETQQKQRTAQQVTTQVEQQLATAGKFSFCAAAQSALAAGSRQIYADVASERVFAQQAEQAAVQLDTATNIPVSISFAPGEAKSGKAVLAVTFTVSAGKEKPYILTTTVYLPNIEAKDTTLAEFTAAQENEPYTCVVFAEL